MMKCHDVRRAFPLLIAGEIPLTEWALLETHVAGCEECRKELNRLQAAATENIRARRRQAAVAGVVATVVLLVVAGGAFYVYENGLSQVRRPDSFWFSPPPAAPTRPAAPAPVVRTPPGDLPAAVSRPPRPAPAAVPLPTRPAVSTPIPAPVRVPPPAASPAPAPGLAEEGMPTQASPSRVLDAAPTAEAMPTQGPAPSTTGRR